jgi:phosphomannomutase/phosphoglucomutase
MSVFRAYDIRGIYPEEVNEELAENIGKSFGTFLPESATIAVAGDVRLSTPSLKSKLISGLLSTGANVMDIGMATTPMLYFTVARYGLEGGIAVTASHNPGEYNGFKPVGRGGVCLNWETGIRTMKEIMDRGKFRTGKGKLEPKNIEDAYITHLLSRVKIKRKLKVVIDAGNGACSLVSPKVFRKTGCEVVELFCEPDGSFPNHEANPVKKENLASLQEKVKETKADIGIAYDTDGDRLGVVNGKGGIVENNKIFSLFIKDILEKKPGSPVVYEVVVSKAVEDTIKKYGGIPVISRVGHSYIHSSLTRNKAVLGGENSGHYYFPENFGYDDAIFASLKAAELLNRGPLTQREKEIPDYLTSEEFRPFCPDEKKFQLVKDLQRKFREEGYNVTEIDGARVVLQKGWLIIRASNTAPQLVVRWEAKDRESFGQIEGLVREKLGSAGVALNGN